MQQSTEETRYCVNCANVATSAFDKDKYRCRAPENVSGRINLVTGLAIQLFDNCEDARNGTIGNGCGTYGKWFKERPAYVEVIPGTTIPKPKKPNQIDVSMI